MDAFRFSPIARVTKMQWSLLCLGRMWRNRTLLTPWAQPAQCLVERAAAKLATPPPDVSWATRRPVHKCSQQHGHNRQKVETAPVPIGSWGDKQDVVRPYQGIIKAVWMNPRTLLVTNSPYCMILLMGTVQGGQIHRDRKWAGYCPDQSRRGSHWVQGFILGGGMS